MEWPQAPNVVNVPGYCGHFKYLTVMRQPRIIGFNGMPTLEEVKNMAARALGTIDAAEDSAPFELACVAGTNLPYHLSMPLFHTMSRLNRVKLVCVDGNNYRAIAALALTSYQASLPSSDAFAASLLTAAYCKQQVYAITLDEVPVGLLRYTNIGAYPHMRIMVLSILVDQRHQNYGIGSAALFLLHQCCALRPKVHVTVEAYINNRNRQALRAFTKAGCIPQTLDNSTQTVWAFAGHRKGVERPLAIRAPYLKVISDPPE